MALLNTNVSNKVAHVEINDQFFDTMAHVNEQDKDEHGDYGYLSTQCPSIIRIYQLLSMNDNNNMHLLKYQKNESKGHTKTMTSTSVRNLASCIDAVTYANFLPVPEKLSVPKDLPRGCVKMIHILPSITG